MGIGEKVLKAENDCECKICRKPAEKKESQVAEMASITHYMHENRGRIGVAVRMAWPSVLESFFVALAGLIDSLMVSKMGAYAVAAVGLTTQPKFLGLALFIALNV